MPLSSFEILALISVVAFSSPGYAQDITFWRDPAQGCTYIVTPQGGATLRYKRDGTPDCIPPSTMQGQTPTAPAPYINPALQAGGGPTRSALAESALRPTRARTY